MKTKAAVLRNIGGPLVIEDIEIPSLQSGQVLIRVLCAGLCHTQLNEIAGHRAAEYIPHLTGHEASAIVVDVAPDVYKVERGDYVVATWLAGLGRSFHSVSYSRGAEKINAGACAVFGEHVIVAENRLVKIPLNMPSGAASLLGCAALVGMAIVDGLGDIGGKKVAVFGIGGVGASVLMRAHSLGSVCTAVDVMSWKMQWAKACLEVHQTICAREESQLLRAGFDVAIECSGNKRATELAFESVHDKGVAIVAGNLAPCEKISIDPYDLIKGKSIKGSWGGGASPDTDIPKYVELHLSGELNIETLITKAYSLEDINNGFEDLKNGRLIRGIVRF